MISEKHKGGVTDWNPQHEAPISALWSKRGRWVAVEATRVKDTARSAGWLTIEWDGAVNEDCAEVGYIR